MIKAVVTYPNESIQSLKMKLYVSGLNIDICAKLYNEMSENNVQIYIFT